MQSIHLVCVGKLNARFCADGVAEYSKRLAAFCDWRLTELPEAPLPEKNAGEALVARALDKEADAILAAVGKKETLVALCVEGKELSSPELAALLQEKALSGQGALCFVIGSSHGLAPRVKQAAALRFSMGRITLPHQLARLVLAEQLYRACAINAGVRYHK